MPSNTPLPAAELLRLADALADGVICTSSTKDLMDLRFAYVSARAASPVTLEEKLMVDFITADTIDLNGSSAPWVRTLQRLEKHARALAEAQKGGAK